VTERKTTVASVTYPTRTASTSVTTRENWSAAVTKPTKVAGICALIAFVLVFALSYLSSGCNAEDFIDEDALIEECNDIIEDQREQIVEEAYAECQRAAAEFLVALKAYFDRMLEDLGCVRLSTNYWDCEEVCK
jgi:hypothetical protein